MTKEDLRIVFMGTPEFAVESLKVLVENGYNVVGVITMPDKPSGRGHKIQYSAVKKYALEHNLNILQPEKLKAESFVSELSALKADLQIVVAFRMLPEAVWNMPPLGTFNLHGSLLPQYRGAAPINWAIINGEKETGVSTFFLVHEIDEGSIILQEKVAIADNDNVGIVYDKLMTIGSKLVQTTVDLIIGGEARAIAQEQLVKNESELKAAPKIFKETCQIDWTKSAQDIHNHVRGLSPYPVAWTELVSEKEIIGPIKIYATEIEPLPHSQARGTLVTDNKTYLKVACKDGYIVVKQLQLPGKRAMECEELLRGYKFEEGSIFK